VRRRALLPLLALLLLPRAGEAQIYTRVNSHGVVEATNVPDASDFRLTYPGKGTLIHSLGFRGIYNGEYDRHILDAASIHGVPVDLVKAVIQVESEYDRYAVSSKGAQGLMQLMPFTARRFGVSDPFDPRQNIFGGVQYLRLLLDLFQGDTALAVAAYNSGENNVTRYHGIPPFKETQLYVQRVQSYYRDAPRTASYSPTIAFAPSPGALPQAGGTPKATKLVPARPRVFYAWQGENGTPHVADEPPDDGVSYRMIRVLD
jgi:hypothetical protein